ncbi:MAG: shikimate dehydrogenase [Deltaproteobacteria bacterium]|nr:shikimate dehydrogenase [Deltaproteobacteria bacterium]
MLPDAKTVLHAVFGHPVGHSLSPSMHNRAFSELGLNCVYLAFDVTDIGAAMKAVRTLSMRGASVTIPHKLAVMDHLDEVDEAARKMGAVNTIINDGGRLYGKNTDGLGAVIALEEKISLAGKSLLLLGSGGAARAVAHAVKNAGAKVAIAHRPEDAQEAETLAGEVNAKVLLLSQASGESCDIAVNATPLGMAPKVEDTPVSADFFRPGMVVMDVVYNPLETRFLREAKQKGCETVDGAAMFVYQGAAQFTLWTGREAPYAVMRKTVLDALFPQPGK